ncbi:ASCH domain-containing protein [Bacteroides caccae]|uniref:ASCH domain-containing protein n=1 Tax=Bacteroides caccae TaxID=47678 RepID=UPI0022AA9B33|nr:ASCH domain-containing protein [Bacteroides caccae]MCZ2726271.1 ASCH domain-containing protein [Bacteroides caccae]
MKAITIKQPWASLIVHGIKDVENRTWRCPDKYIGQRVLIHASKKSANYWDYPVAERVDKFLREITKSGTDWSRYPFGAIIGSVEIVDCVVNHSSIWAEKTENYTVGMNPKLHENITGKKVIYNWVLANPVLFEKPIPAKGRLSFWEYDGLLAVDARDLNVVNILINKD